VTSIRRIVQNHLTEGSEAGRSCSRKTVNISTHVVSGGLPTLGQNLRTGDILHHLQLQAVNTGEVAHWVNIHNLL